MNSILPQISTTLLLIRSIQSLPPSMIPKNHFPVLLSSLQKSLSAIVPAAPTSPVYLNWQDAAQNVPFQCVYYHLRLLDMYFLRQWGSLNVRNKDEVDTGAKEKGLLKRKNERALHKARDEWLSGALIAVGVCAELRGGRMFVFYIHVAKTDALVCFSMGPDLHRANTSCTGQPYPRR